MAEEGWYVDPFGIHQARWISDGTPTALVRDGDSETQDPPPAVAYQGPLQELAEENPVDGEDLRRADSADATTFDPMAEEDVAWDAFGEFSGGD
jgi:hypothetical protein